MSQVVVVGAGISGLALAYRLQQSTPNIQVTVLEAVTRPGGTILTRHKSGFTIELGPNGFLDSQPSTLKLASDAGLGDRLVAASEASRKHRYLSLGGGLTALPTGPLAFLRSPLLSLRSKLRLLAEPFIRGRKGNRESVFDFAARRFGREAAEVLFDAIVTGIHGGDAKLLDIRAAFPRLAAWEAESGSVVHGLLRSRRGQPRRAPRQLWSFAGGLSELTDTLTARLRVPPMFGVRVRRVQFRENSWTVQGEGSEQWSADQVVLACPARHQAAMLAEIDPELADLVAGIRYNRIAVVSMGFAERDLPRPATGFGFIVPQATRRDLLGVQWCSSIYAGRAPTGIVLWRALCGGWNRGDVVDWTDERLVAAVRNELRSAQGVTAEPRFTHVHRWPEAIPQYELGHPERLAAIEARRRLHPGLFLAGNAYRGVGLNDCTADAERLAEQLAPQKFRD